MARPTKYKTEMCEQVIDHMAKGFSKEATAAHIGICEDTLYDWIKTNPKFSEAIKEGSLKSRLWWEKTGMGGMLGKLPGFSASTWIFNMKNRHGWADKTEISGKDGGPIETVTKTLMVEGVSPKASDT